MSQDPRTLDEAFLSMIAHELRTPLTTIKAYLQLAQRRIGAPAGEVNLQEVAAMLAKADRQASHMARLVNDLLDVTRMHTGKFSLDVAPCALDDLVQEAVSELSQLFPRHAIHLRPCPWPQTVLVDAERVKQVVTNYLTNAIKYTPADAPIQVGVERGEREARVSVQDAGPGLSRRDQERIWDRFYQVNAGQGLQRGSHEGLGLGLYICRCIIEAHQGQVGVESVPGQGSTFWFTLPL